MSVIDNFLHFDDRKTINISISELKGIGNALTRIADELEKSNNYTGKHLKEDD